MAEDPDVNLVVEAASRIPIATYPGGWHGQVEAALIDAVLSIRAKYGNPANGVRGAIRAYQATQPDRRLDDLNVLAGFDPSELALVLKNKQRISGVSKAEVIVQAAKNFVSIGVCHADELDTLLPEHRYAYTSVKGLGDVTWEYLGMNLGKPGVKADTWICRFVTDAVGRRVSSREARLLVIAAAGELGRPLIELDHSIWAYAKSLGAISDG